MVVRSRKTTPRRGKAKVKITSSGKKVSFGQAGKAKSGGPRVKPGTSKGDSYCHNKIVAELNVLLQKFKQRSF